MRKVVILNASPRKDGNISQMLNIMGDTLFEKGTEVTIIDVCKLEFRSCIGCMKCRSTHDCVMPEDDAKRILRMVRCPCGRFALLLGQHDRATQNAFRPLGLRHDGSQRTRLPDSTVKGKESCHCYDMYYPMAVQHFVQTVGRHRSCPQGNPMLERIQDCRCDSKRRNP